MAVEGDSETVGFVIETQDQRAITRNHFLITEQIFRPVAIIFHYRYHQHGHFRFSQNSFNSV